MENNGNQGVANGVSAMTLEEYMGMERFMPVECMNWKDASYQISNYGNMASVVLGRGGSSSGNTTHVVFVGENGERTKVPTGFVVLYAHAGVKFNVGDSVEFLDGNKRNNRLDNLRYIPVGEELSNKVTFTTMIGLPVTRKYRNRSGVGKPAEQQKKAGSAEVSHSKLYNTMMRRVIMNMFEKSNVPQPVSLLYGCLVDAAPETKEIVGFEEFYNMMISESVDYCVGLRLNRNDVSRMANDGYMSYRLAVWAKCLYSEDDGFKNAKFHYVQDKKAGHIIDFNDLNVVNGDRYRYYPALTYIELMRLLADKGIYTSVVYQTSGEGSVFVCIAQFGNDSYEAKDKDYESAIEGCLYKLFSHIVEGGEDAKV